MIRAALICVILATNLMACIIKSKPALPKNQSAPVPQGPLIITANLIDGDGRPIDSALVFFHQDQISAGRSDALGRIRLQLPRAILNERAALGDARVSGKDFYLSIIADAPANLGVTSAAIPFSSEGSVDLGELTLKPLIDVKGTILGLGEDYLLTPSDGAELAIANRTARADGDGAFAVTGIPMGTSIWTIRDSHGETHAIEIEVDASRPTLENPVVIFPKKSVQAAIFPLEPSDSSLAFTNAPMLKNFELQSSSAATKMRLSDKRDDLLKASFQPVRHYLSYTFATSGANQLYVQVANESETEQSQVLSATAIVGANPREGVITIGDGSGIIPARKARIYLRVPDGATKMRLAETEDDFASDGTAQWRIPTEELDFVFINNRAGNVQLFVQFGFDDDETLMFSETAIVMPFPPSTASLFTINGGATEAHERVVRLDIQVPPPAVEMQVRTSDFNFQSSSTFGSSGGFFGSTSTQLDNNAPWISVSPIFFHSFQFAGLKTLYLTFRDIDQIESPTYSQIIRIDPFIGQPIGFVIGDGSGRSLLPNVTISLVPPYSAISYRIWNDASGTNVIGEWATITPTFDYVIPGNGPQKLNLQYRNIDGIQSPFFSQVVTLDLFPAPALEGILNGGAAATVNRNVTATFPNPPIAAISVRISETLTDMELLPGVSFEVPVQFQLSTGAGEKIVYFQFVASTGASSPVFSDKITLQ